MKLTRFPLIFVLVWIFPFINRITNWVDGSDGFMWLNVMHVISQGLQGILNAVVYFWDEDWRTQCTPDGIRVAAVTLLSRKEREAQKPQRYELGDVSDEATASAGEPVVGLEEVSLATSSDSDKGSYSD
jgi:hypothetical protein